jgi:glutamyl-tRNA synthetase
MFSSFRTRFAPSPSGTLHIGNLRSALMSFLCAKESNGTFILRIEDTDQTRTEDRFLQQIYHFLSIMNLIPDEGPQQGGKYTPYIQSERTAIYETYLALFKEKGLIYRCFQTETELEERRKKQAELKLPPRHIKQELSAAEEKTLLEDASPFVWRLSLPKKSVHIIDKVKGTMSFNLSHFADVPLTRQDGSCTFLFANFVDDITMNITYVIRGEEHISNTAVQAYMYEAINQPLPLFYHLPLIGDQEGKKLSKRNFGFNIQDLLNEGFLPEAIINYLIIIGGSYKEEIFTLEEAIEKKLFSENKSAGMITYDVKKLLWVNKKWIQKLPDQAFLSRLEKSYPNTKGEAQLALALKHEIHTLKECADIIEKINTIADTAPTKQVESVYKKIAEETIIPFLQSQTENYITWLDLKNILDKKAEEINIQKTNLYKAFRYLLIRSEEGISLALLCKHITVNDMIKKISISISA